jgi:hypothetical protein
MRNLLSAIPFWCWCVVAFLGYAGCEDIRRARCDEAGKQWVKGNVVDSCISRKAPK